MLKGRVNSALRSSYQVLNCSSITVEEICSTKQPIVMPGGMKYCTLLLLSYALIIEFTMSNVHKPQTEMEMLMYERPEVTLREHWLFHKISVHPY